MRWLWAKAMAKAKAMSMRAGEVKRCIFKIFSILFSGFIHCLMCVHTYGILLEDQRRYPIHFIK